MVQFVVSIFFYFDSKKSTDVINKSNLIEFYLTSSVSAS